MARKAKDLLPEFERRFSRPRPGRALVVGSRVYPGRKDRRGRYMEAWGIDLVAGPGVDEVLNLERPPPAHMVRAFAHVECVSVLEHARQPWMLARHLEEVLEPGGTLLLSVPWCWRFHAYPNDYWRFTPSGVRLLFARIEWSVLRLATRGKLSDSVERLPTYEVDGHVAFARTEIIGFGSRCASS